MRKAKYLFTLLSVTGAVILSPTVAQTSEKIVLDRAGHTQVDLNVTELAQGTTSQPTDSTEDTMPGAVESENESTEGTTPVPTQENIPGSTDSETEPSQPATPDPNQTQESLPGSSGSEPAPSLPATSSPDQPRGDYSQLQTYLQQQNWRAADQETFDVMLQVAGTNSQNQGRFELNAWQNFPCTDLKEVDRLWSETSEGKLGFSAQKRVLEGVQRNYVVFYTRIGWFDLLTNAWNVAWEYDQDTKKAEYLAGKEPLFDTPIQELREGYLPAKLEWETTEGEAPVDRRFERIYACSL